MGASPRPETPPRNEWTQAALYDEAVASFGPALERLAASYEFDRTKREDLLQEIHLNVWRSFASFDGRCSFGRGSIASLTTSRALM